MTVPSPSAPTMPPRVVDAPVASRPVASKGTDESTGDRLARGATDAASTATAALSTAADAAGDFARRQQPLVMAAAFGLGVFIGIMIRRR